MRELIGQQARTWRFEPALIDGQPVVARTRFRLKLAAGQLADENYRFSISNAWFGEPEREHQMAPPIYPRNAVDSDVGASVILILKLDNEGRVLDAYARQVNLHRDYGERSAGRWRTMFEQASLKAARQWRFKPGALINGEALASTVAVPVSFPIGRPRGWQSHVPGPIKPSPWPEPNKALGDIGALSDDEAMPLDSQFRLAEEVKGRVLQQLRRSCAAGAMPELPACASLDKICACN